MNKCEHSLQQTSDLFLATDCFSKIKLYPIFNTKNNVNSQHCWKIGQYFWQGLTPHVSIHASASRSVAVTVPMVTVSMQMVWMAVIRWVTASLRSSMAMVMGVAKGTDTNKVYYQPSNWDWLARGRKENL